MATWPATLPVPEQRGYKLKPASQVLRTDMEKGQPKVRRFTRARQDKISCVVVFTKDQMTVFRAWFDEPGECNGGAAWFTTDLDKGEGGIETVEARFAGEWDAALITGSWEMVCTFEVR